MKDVDEVFKKLNEEFGDQLFDITRQGPDMTEAEAEQIMEEFTEDAGKFMEGLDVK